MNGACDISKRPPAPEGNPGDEVIGDILRRAKMIAVIGVSAKPGRPSLDVALYLKAHGYQVIPVNPQLKEWEGAPCYPSLSDVPGPVDIVDVFRKPETLAELAAEIGAKQPICSWFQLGIVNNEAAAKIRQAGVVAVQDKCIMVEHARLIGG